MTGSAAVDHQLVFIRSLFDRAIAAQRENSDLGLMAAFLFLDIGVETLNKHILTGKVERPEKKNAEELVEEVQKAFPTLRDRPVMGVPSRLRRARNPIQHEAHVPSSAEVSRHLEDARMYVEVVVRELFGVSFDDISSVSLVRTPYLREALQKSLEYLRAQDLEFAVVFLAAVFKVMLIRADTWVRVATGKDLTRDGFRGIILDPVILYVFGTDFPDCAPRGDLDDVDYQLAHLSLKLSIVELCELQAAQIIADEIMKRRGKELERARQASQNEGDNSGPLPTPESSAQIPKRNPFELDGGRVVTAADVASMIEILAQRLWHLETTDRDLVDGRHRSSPFHRRG